MDTSDTSETTHSDTRSDCDSVKQIWTVLLLKWLNRCVHPKNPVIKLTKKSLLAVVNTYKDDIGEGVPESNLSMININQLIRYNYPALKLSHITNKNKKIYIMTSVLLYHCCVSSISGMVDNAICTRLSKSEQVMILKFCETLTDMRITCNDVYAAINYACKTTLKTKQKHKTLISTGSPGKAFVMTTIESPQSSSSVMPSISSLYEPKARLRNFNLSSTVTVVPSDSHFPPILLVHRSSVDMRNKQITTCNAATMPLEEKDVTYSNLRWLTFRNNSKGLPWSVLFVVPSLILTVIVIGVIIHKSPPPGRKITELIPEMIDAEPEMDNPISDRKTYSMSLFRKTHGQKYKNDRTKPETNGPNSENKISTKYPIDAAIRKPPEKDKIYYNYLCINTVCQRAFGPVAEEKYISLSRCILQCMKPQLWPKPSGFTFFNDKIVAMATSKLKYTFQKIPSDQVKTYLSQAFKLFLTELERLESVNLEQKHDNEPGELFLRNVNLQLSVESDPDPRIRLNTDEAYQLNVDVVEEAVTINIVSPSFCGVRHGLETLSQLILLDQSTGYLITLSRIAIQDKPSYKYRGLMIDTAKNYIPTPDLMRTIDAMASCKLNTFHWRISDAASFPLLLPLLPQLFEYGGYDRSLVYTKEDVKAIVEGASIRGIRVLLEVAAPGPVGRAWAWTSEATCPKKNKNLTCSNNICLRLTMSKDVMQFLQVIYSEILEMTQVNDVFHLSNGLFAIARCKGLLESRKNFLTKALNELKIANKGVLPKLPIIWYTDYLNQSSEAESWNKLGVQLSSWITNTEIPYLKNYKVIQSTRWDLSCTIQNQRCLGYRTWQTMYAWMSWRNVDAESVEGGEAILWTDLVDSGNLDLHLWPRAAAVAERLWSDAPINATVDPSVYIRLDSHRWRLMLRSVKVPPVWPLFCSYNMNKCIRKITKPIAINDLQDNNT